VVRSQMLLVKVQAQGGCKVQAQQQAQQQVQQQVQLRLRIVLTSKLRLAGLAIMG
jgi:hypothetical protein